MVLKQYDQRLNFEGSIYTEKVGSVSSEKVGSVSSEKRGSVSVKFPSDSTKCAITFYSVLCARFLPQNIGLVFIEYFFYPIL